MANGSIKGPKYKVLTRGTVPCMQKHDTSGMYLQRVVAPNLPTKTDDLSHSTGYGWAI
uniref:Uncharacterized protein n=1 Tax=Oryza sativa subsp. japonica TaxID=39947 RepID=Q69WH3_ORYSJ|nr:hypothetical protein [Oryza sativa Japonica Group]BAD32966.1 hypothetical protein [Oryza sativa Japonica Group]